MKRFGMTSFMISLLLVTGCASSGVQYYEAVQRTAEANALASEARYKALAQVAQSGDGQAASAAVMAIALTQETRITPQVVEHDALKWAKVLMPGLSTLGMAWLQTDLAKTQSNNSKDIQMAMHGHNEAIQLGQQNMVLGLGESWTNGSAASSDALLTMGVAGFDALNYCLLAEGRVDAVIEANLKPYDILPLIPIIRKSGGIVTTWNNRAPERGGNIIASSNIVLHKKILKILKPFTKK